MLSKTYSEMVMFDSFEDRFEYLKLTGSVAGRTFGGDRYINQDFYRSAEWRKVRRDVIARDEACDLSHSDHPISGKIIIHHINPLTPDEIEYGGDGLFDMNNLVCVSHITHNAIHYGDSNLLPKPLVERRPGDTKLW